MLTGVVVPLLKKGDQRVCDNYRGITLLSLPGKVYAKVLERRVRPIVEPQIQEEQCGFRPGRGTTDQIYTLTGILEKAWEYAYPVYSTCVLWIWRRYTTGSPGRSCGRCWGSMGWGGPCCGPSNLCTPKARAVSVCSGVSRIRFQWGLASVRAAHCHLSCLWFSWTGSRGEVVSEKVFDLVS